MPRQIQHEQSGDVDPCTNAQSEGAWNSLHDPQVWPLADAALLNMTADLGTLTVALAAVAASKDAEPAATPPASNVLREIRVELTVSNFFMISSLTA